MTHPLKNKRMVGRNVAVTAGTILCEKKEVFLYNSDNKQKILHLLKGTYGAKWIRTYLAERDSDCSFKELCKVQNIHQPLWLAKTLNFSFAALPHQKQLAWYLPHLRVMEKATYETVEPRHDLEETCAPTSCLPILSLNIAKSLPVRKLTCKGVIKESQIFISVKSEHLTNAGAG